MQDSDESTKAKVKAKAAEAFADSEAKQPKIVEAKNVTDNGPASSAPSLPKSGSYSLQNINLDEIEIDAAKKNQSDSTTNINNGDDKDEKYKHLIGKLIDNKYQVEAFIGSGGMSSVYKIKHLLLNKTLALKMIHPHLANDKESLARFQREAEATSRLDHPNVVKVWEFGITDGSPYIIMDYIEGRTLSQEFADSKGRKLDPERAVKIISQACSALSHAHNRNIVHRDIKPSNIMLVNQDDQKDVVKVVDFGIAQVVAEDTELAKLTQTGQIFGTPMYMSPEQCQGHKLDARTDIYSLGCVLYEALTGATPFVGSSVYELIFKQMNEAPAGLGKSVPNRVLRDTLETVIFRSIAKESSDRYQSMQELKDDLDNVGKAPAKGPVQYLSAFIRQWYFRQLTRNLRPMLKQLPIMAGTVLLLGGAAYFAFQQSSQLSMPTNLAPEKLWEKLDKEGQEAFDQGNKEKAEAAFKNGLSLAKKMENKDLTRSSLDELLDLYRAKGDGKNIAETDAELAPLIKAPRSLAELNEELDTELSKLKGKITDSKEIERLGQVASSAMDEAMTFASYGDSAAVRQVQAKIKKLADLALPDNDPLIVRCLHNEAYMEHVDGNYDSAIEAYHKAIATGDKILPANSTIKGKSRSGLASLLMQMGSHLDEAEQMLKEYQINLRANFGPTSAQTANSWYLLASLYKQQGRMPEAKAALNRAIGMFEMNKSPETSLSSLSSLGKCYQLKAGMIKDKALSLKALAIFEEAHVKDYQPICQVLVQLANVTVAENPAQAQAYLDRAKAISQRFKKADQEFKTADFLQAQAAVNQKQGKFAQAEQDLRQVLKLIDEKGEKDGIGKLITLGRLAGVLAEKKDSKAAEEIYKELFAAIEKKKGAKEAVGMKPFYEYVRLLNSQDRKDEAKALADRWNKMQ